MDLGIAGRVALVTAASKGLGRGAARALAAEGAKVVICARNPEALETTRAELAGVGAEVLAIPGDVTRPEVPGELVRASVEAFGRLDIVVANAGGPPAGRALEVDDAAMEAAFNANLLTSVRLVRAGVPHMVRAGWGRICCITSFSVVQPVPGLALSNLSRVGLWAWAKTAAADLAAGAGPGVTLNLACPGHHATDRMVALGASGSMGDPDDFGRVVAFLCSVPAGFVNGAAVVVDGGATLAL
ncbi:MAG: SDR family oxidoreductase [Acidimicrobiales bacterium]